MGKVRPILPVSVHKEFLQRHNSMDSFSNMSIGDVGGALDKNEPRSPSDPEKKLVHYPDLSYAALSISGETKVNKDSLRLPSFPSSSTSLNSSATSATYPTPEPARTHQGIEVSSVHDRDGSINVVEPITNLNPPSTTSNTPSESSSQIQSQPTGPSAVWRRW